MTAYRFCRTDDIGLLVDAVNRCWSPYFPDQPAMTPAAFKRSIRDLQVWCSSCMVAFSGADPIAVLIGAKRPSGTLVHKIAVHPDHRRQGHGRHLLTSLGSKLAILGPPRIVAEVPESQAPACELFSATGFAQEALLTDHVWTCEEDDAGETAAMAACPEPSTGSGSSRAMSRDERAPQGSASRMGFVIPVTVDDLAANGLLGEAEQRVCWKGSVETLTARKDDIAGLAVASDEGIEACVLYLTCAACAEGTAEIVALRTFVEDDGGRLKALLARLRAQGMNTLRIPKVHPAEFPDGLLATLGFRPAGGHRLYAATARSN
jgi:GNAT superfamily N-acetyltransferase